MILDNALLLSGAVSAAGVLTGQLVTANSTVSTNTVDLGPLAIGGNQAGNIGAGEGIQLEFSILVAPAAATDVTFQIIQADDAALSVNVEVIDQTGAFPIAQLPAGTLVPLTVSRVSPLTPRRYIGARYIATGVAITSLSVVAALVKDIQDKQTSYKSGFAVS